MCKSGEVYVRVYMQEAKITEIRGGDKLCSRAPAVWNTEAKRTGEGWVVIYTDSKHIAVVLGTSA